MVYLYSRHLTNNILTNRNIQIKKNEIINFNFFFSIYRNENIL